MRIVTGLLSLFIIFFSGCGYSLQGGGMLPGDVKSVSVLLFKNRTGQIGAEASITGALIDELMRGSRAAIPNSPGDADAVIHGEILSITFGAVSRTSDDAVYERSVTAKVNVRMKSRSGELLFSVSKLSENDTYNVPIGNEADEQAKKEAVDEIFQRLAERLVSNMTDNF